MLNTGNAVAVHQMETPLIAGQAAGPGRKAAGRGRHRVRAAAGHLDRELDRRAKGLLTGWPVLTGMEAALYAKSGINGRRDILENPAGYCYRLADIATPAGSSA